MTGEPQLALAIARATPPGAFGIVEYVCRSAPTLGEALQRSGCATCNLLDDAVEVALDVEGDRAYLRVVRESEAPAPASHELCFALVAQQASQLSARAVPDRRGRATHIAAAMPRAPSRVVRRTGDVRRRARPSS